VTYQADYFLDKNKDYVVAEHQALLDASSRPLLQISFLNCPRTAQNNPNSSSIGTRFK
ncbi:hypothetical protein MKX01_015363, partial [Papaver californicum]